MTKYPRGPAARGQRYLCLTISARGKRRMLCYGGAKRRRLGKSVVSGTEATRDGAIAARVARANRSSVEIAFRPQAAGLRPGAFRWSVVSGWSGDRCRPEPEPAGDSDAIEVDPPADGEPADTELPDDRCRDKAPDGPRGFRGRVFELRPAGCTRPGPSVVRGGPAKGKRIALTFDDGPSSFTAGVIRALDRGNARGTFFPLGTLARGRAAILRRAVAGGHEIANHSWRHSTYPGFGDLRATSRVIESASGFEPCSFRPPGGAFSSATVSAAARNEMRTVLWDVDPRDWTTPGTSAIAARVISAARPGSIVVMHDGGGYRGQTVAALPRIISTLRARGYSFTTVHRLLGGRTIYGKVR